MKDDNVKKLLLALCLLGVGGTFTWVVLRLQAKARLVTLQTSRLCSLGGSPETTVIAFDVHEVIVKARFSDIRTLLWREVPKMQLLKTIFNPFLLGSIMRLYRSSPGVEPFLKKLTTQHPELAWVSTLYFTAFNCQTLNEPLLAYIRTLKDLGFALYVFSNIESQALANLRVKFPVLDTLFDGFFIPGYYNSYYFKPDTSFYEEFKYYIAQHRRKPTSIILVDNFPANIQSAYKTGIYGLLFTSADQLKCILTQVLTP